MEAEILEALRNSDDSLDTIGAALAVIAGILLAAFCVHFYIKGKN